MTNETEVQTEGQEQPTSILDTPEVKVEAPPAQAHRGRIVSVETLTSEKGSTGMHFSLESIDTGREDTYDLWMPAAFVADIHVDPKELPTETGNNQRSQYTIGISNSDKDATLQVLRQIALEAQPNALEGKESPSNFEEYVSLNNVLLSGVELIYLLAPDRKAEPPFHKRLRVQRFYPMSAMANPKVLRKVKKAWEGEV